MKGRVGNIMTGKLQQYILLLLLLFVYSHSHSQSVGGNTMPRIEAQDSIKSKPVNYVYLLHANVTSFDKDINPDAYLLVGDVSFRHDSMYMYCDTAYFYTKQNSLQAYSNVRMEQGDTLFLYGDYLHYDGDLNLARVRNNVRLEDKNSILETDSLDYDRNKNLGYYFEGGTLYDEHSTLDSQWGQYNTATKQALFVDNVHLKNPDFFLTSDTLYYNTGTNIAQIVGPTDILNKESKIYSEKGFYDTNSKQATLLDRSRVSNMNKELTADSLYYDELSGYSQAFGNILFLDTINKNMLTGEYAYFDELKDSAYATINAIAIDYSQGDSLYMHADTIWMVTLNNDTDSIYREMRAYKKVRAYRSDIQAVCDSMIFDSRDSCLTMYTDPIVWNQGQQLLGEKIKMYMDASSIDWIHVIEQSLYSEMMDSVNYNQIKGREMKFFFKDKKLDTMEVLGNVQIIYFPLDDDSTVVGMNTTEASKLTIYLKDGQMHRMVIPSKSNGVFYPMSQRPPDKQYLSNFVWFDYIRPTDKHDILNWRGKKREQQLKKTHRKEVPLPTLDKFKE